MTDLGAEVVTYVSHATQQRLQNLLEKVSQVAQQKNVNFKVCLQQHYKETKHISATTFYCIYKAVFSIELTDAPSPHACAIISFL